MMRLLLIEDDPMIGAGVQQALREDGYAVDWVRDGIAERHGARLVLEASPLGGLRVAVGFPPAPPES